MKTRRVKMSLAEYHLLPYNLGWKQEYINGFLVESPRQAIAHATIPVAPRAAASPAQLRPLLDADERALLPCFRAAFVETIEFCDYTRKRFAESARQSLHHFFHGPFHRVLPASRVAVHPAKTGKPIGAALVLAQDEGWALLDMIFVSPAWQRQGLATALAASALTALHELGGYRTLVSRYYLGNETSAAWHHRFGFVDEPDLMLAQLRLRAAQQELRRRRELGPPTSSVLEELAGERDRCQQEVNRLEAALKAGREEEAWPWRKWRRKQKDENDEEIAIRNPSAA